jgi:hypothetical protein
VALDMLSIAPRIGTASSSPAAPSSRAASRGMADSIRSCATFGKAVIACMSRTTFASCISRAIGALSTIGARTAQVGFVQPFLMCSDCRLIRFPL